jgi:hypothetical protein
MTTLNSTTEKPGSELHGWELLVAAAIGVFCSVRWTIRAGKGISWDQKNYHFYNAYAWLAGRMDYNLTPAGQHSWLSPFLYLPQYWLINHASPVRASAIFAAAVGLNFALVYALARLTIGHSRRSVAVLVSLLCGWAGFYDPFVFTGLGTTDSDGIVSLFILAALCAVCWARADRAEPLRQFAFASAGVLLGFAAGLKWTCMVYAVGATVALIVLWRTMHLNRRLFLCFAAGGVLGYLPLGGYWNWLLWTRYGNPFFPYWNDLFRSPWIRPIAFRDMRFPPQTVEAAVSFPFQWFVGLHPTSEGDFRVATFAFLAVLIPLVILTGLGEAISQIWRPRRGQSEETMMSSLVPLWFLMVYSTVSYILWIHMFAIQRYLLPLSLLSGLLIWLCLDYLIPVSSAKVAAFALLAGFSIHWMQMEKQDWRQPYGTTWFGFELPAEVQSPETLFVMLGGGPMACIVPYLPSSSRTVRLIDSTVPADGTETELSRRAAILLAQHHGAMRSLSIEPLQTVDFDYLKRFGLALSQDQCVQFRSATDQFTTCPITRVNAN